MLLSIGPLGTNFSEISIKTQKFSFRKMHLKISSVKWWPFSPGRDELTHWRLVTAYGIMNFDNIGSGNGLMPDGTKPLLDPKLTYHEYVPLKYISWPFVSHISEENKCKYKIFKMSAGPNELTNLSSRHMPLICIWDWRLHTILPNSLTTSGHFISHWF